MSQASPAPLSPDEQTLQSLLQAAIDVELFTIPLYMTAAYSLRFTTADGQIIIPEPFYGAVPGNGAAASDPSAEPSSQPLSDNQTAFNIVFTVFLQEMLHLMVVCNLSKALGFTPILKSPDYTIGKLPHIKEPPSTIPVALGPLDRDRLALFQYIETPSFAGEAYPLTEPPEGFQTIGALYKALRYWVNKLWSQRYTPSAFQGELFQYKNYPSEYTNKTISGDPATALIKANSLIDEIVLQGEGADAAGDVPMSYQPNLTEEAASSRAEESNDAKVRAYWDQYSHYVRFEKDLAPLIGNLPLWPVHSQDEQQVKNLAALDLAWEQLLSQMNAFYNPPPFPFVEMRAFNSLITSVWASGGTPDFKAQKSKAAQ